MTEDLGEAIAKAAGSFGLARIMEEGAPIHPDYFEWECDLRLCGKCAARYDRQLLAWNAWEIYRGRNPFT